MIHIVVDANIILSALLGGSARFVLFDHRFLFITSSHTIDEVSRYLPYVSKKSGVSVEELSQALGMLPLEIHEKAHYAARYPEAQRMMQDIDSHDSDILALYLTESTYLWSEDKGFEKIQPSIHLLKTKDFF